MNSARDHVMVNRAGTRHVIKTAATRHVTDRPGLGE